MEEPQKETAESTTESTNSADVNTPTKNEGKVDTAYWVIGGIFVVVIIAAVAGYFFVQQLSAPQAPSNQDGQGLSEDNPYTRGPAAELRGSNTTYQEARFALGIQDYDRAVQLYEESLDTTDNPDERGQIKYELALVRNKQGDDLEAVRTWKEIVANEDVSDLIRASSVEAMAKRYYSEGDPAIFDEIFSTAPYDDFLVEGDKSESIKNLFEYASSIYPLAYSELRIANWYAHDLVENGGESSTDLSVAEVKNLIREKVANAEADNERLVAAYGNDARTASFLRRKAAVAGQLEQLGDPFLGDPKELFEEALQRARVVGSDESVTWAIYNYAVFLVRARPDTEQERLSVLLSNFYGDGRYASGRADNSAFYDFLRREKNNILDARDDIELFAEFDPQFKEMLNTQLGWNL